MYLETSDTFLNFTSTRTFEENKESSFKITLLEIMKGTTILGLLMMFTFENTKLPGWHMSFMEQDAIGTIAQQGRY